MEFSKEELEEFKNEALELLDEAERHLLSLEKGGNFAKSYDAVFRVFHSLKGGAGMLGMQKVQAHMHQLETHYQQCKSLQSLPKETISYFLKGVDASRLLLNDEEVSFTYTLPQAKQEIAVTLDPVEPTKAPETMAAPVKSAPTQPALPDAKPVEENAVFTDSIPTKVFVIDDEEDIVEILSNLLSNAHFIPVGFTSAEEALKRLKTEKPDVIITDIRMGEISGFDVLKKVADQDPDLPVIFVSGYISKELMVEALSYGVFGAIDKPFLPARVIEVCTNAGQRYRLAKLLSNLISFIYYQYSDLEQLWESKGGDMLREMMHAEFRGLIEAKRKLKALKRRSNQTD